ncbi:hypothetical protein EGW08_010074 [Elysia chlorotica]|uniref:C-type lectin domain-containing protein n=1 Tax=Elysia chlorotica TaxID=188477 RepID=A0A433TKU8_ELYCH|nr:hypothetical protein EGW08_010074 [Elysia chlorotica]
MSSRSRSRSSIAWTLWVCLVWTSVLGEVHDTNDDLNSGLSDREGHIEKRAGRACPRKWRLYGDNCYFFIKKNLPITTARQRCASKGAKLASIQSKEENNFIASKAKARTWVGLSDAENEGLFLLEDGSAASFLNWRLGQPSNSPYDEDCVVLSKVGKWNDLSCTTEKRRALCKMNKPLLGLPCPNGWVTGTVGDYCYLFGEEKMTQPEAIAFCAVNLGLLAKLDSQEEINSIKQYLTHVFWIGANDALEEGTYMWLDLSPVTFFPWASGAPSDQGGDEDCVEMDPQTGDWNDVGCNREEKRFVVCKKPANTK